MATAIEAVTAVLIGLVLVSSSRVRADIHLYVDSIKGNDSLCTPYPNYIMPYSNISCKTIQYALHGNANYASCTEATPLQDVTVHLADGIHSIAKEICITYSGNVALVADHNGQASIQCATFPYNDTTVNRRYENLYLYAAAGVTFRGLNFEHCGVSSSNVFINSSSDILFDKCVFRNNIGPPLQVRFTTSITLVDTQFINNRNMYPASYDYNVVSLEGLTTSINTVTTGGGLTLYSSTVSTNVLISNCTFINNQAGYNLPNTTRPVLFKQNGHGGALLIRLAGTQNSAVVIENCVFTLNSAELDGGAIYISLSENASANRIIISNNSFTNNTVMAASGGAVNLASYFISYNNFIMVNDCLFINNSGNSGGAFGIAQYDSNYNSAQFPDNVTFYKCRFVCNSAINEGTAVGLFSVIRVDQIGFPLSFIDCIFDSNLSIEDLKDTSSLTSFRFPIYFRGKNIFTRNVGGGITLISTRMRTEGELQFSNNIAKFGGGISLYDQCLIEVTPNIVIHFEGNYATESGGAIYVESPRINSLIAITNRACFIQYQCLCNNSLQDYAPQDWKNVSISFIRNTALLNGGAIFASDMRFCTWLSNYSTSSTSLNNATIFKLPLQLKNFNPFHFEANDVEVKVQDDAFKDVDIGTDPLIITALVNNDNRDIRVQPGETVTIDLHAIDQFGNYQEGVWSVDAPGQQIADLDAFSASGGTYIFKVPPFSELKLANGYQGKFTLNFTLLRTIGLTSNITFAVNGCHPGYTVKNELCACDTANPNVVHCDSENRYVYLREGLLGDVTDDNSLTTVRVFQGYLNCDRLGRLKGCKFDFDNPESRCQNNRNGSLCKTCAPGYAITMDLQHCQEVAFCAAGDALLVIVCIVVVSISLFILLFNIELPNEMKGFIFYAQVIGLVYRPYSIAQTTYNTIEDIGVFVNLLGFSLPIPLCLSPSITAYHVALFGYISPVLVIICIIGYVIGARFIKFLSNRSALKGITFLSLFVYKYIADASFLLISCQTTKDGFVFQYDGTQHCDEVPFVIFFVIGLLLVLFVIPVPFIVCFIITKRPKQFHQYVDVITEGLCTRCHWWGGWDIGRRLPFILVAYLIVFESPTLVLSLMSLLALAVLILHLFTKPYKKWQINLIEALILLNLLMVTFAYLDPFTSPLRNEFKTFLLILPYSYPFAYAVWKIGHYIYIRSNYRYRDMKFAAKTSSLSLKVHAKDNGENTDVSKMSDNASSQLTASTNDKLSTRDFTNLSYSLLNSSQSVSLHDMSDLREPLLEK